MRRFNRSIVSLGSLLFGVFVAIAVAANIAHAAPGAAIPEIVIQGHDFAFSGPDQIAAGLIAITLENDGHEPHQANLARLQDGKTIEDLLAAFKQNEGAGMAMLEFVGGPNTVDPGLRQRVVLDLAAGNYVLICFVPSADGVPHLAKGMIRPLRVLAGSSTGTPSEPSAAASVTLKDFAIALPATITAGAQTWQVTNAGPEPHELTLLKLAPGKTAGDVMAFLHQPSSPPPFAEIGGIGALQAGKRGWFDLDLQPGNYVALCFVPTPTDGKPHFAHGMLTPFSVAAGSPAALPATGAPQSGRLLGWLGLGVAAALLLAGGVLWRNARHARR